MTMARKHRIVLFLTAFSVCFIVAGEVNASSTFNDVPTTYWSYVPIETLAAGGITQGCSVSPPLYCPDSPVLRSEMAVFLERAIRGSSFQPPQVSGIFVDVPPDYWASGWIEQFFNDGITQGCSVSPALLYCPNNLISRAEMAVLILKATKGNDFSPPPATGTFADVPISYWAADWIEELYRQNITTGCSANPLKFCPDGTVSRAEMAAFLVRSFDLPLVAQQSINSTSGNRDSIPANAVSEQPFNTQPGFQILANNDLGMHCGDLDHRIASILPPFNVVHAQALGKGAVPQILNDSEVDVYYSAASNAKDPALQKPVPNSIFKTNFWEQNPATGNPLAFDGYDAFYPPGVLQMFPLDTDVGLPVPDVARLYLGDHQLVADQQDMPGVASPYVDNIPQRFARFDTDFPFFVDFPFGYTLTGLNWFAADGIPMTPFDDFGRNNSYPLMRIQAKDKNGGLSGSAGTLLASVDTVVPVSAEADCFRCHTSVVDGGNGEAACIPGTDVNCGVEGSRRTGTTFTVATASGDIANVPAAVSREWAADLNIVRLHDARHGTSLETQTPVVCQRCHYTPALDLAQVGPLGPGDAAANGRDQRTHRSNSRVLHSYHSQFTDLFDNNMPVPTDPNRFNQAIGKPEINAFVQDKLFNSCYQCHPGKNTNCLRGAMFSGGLVCQDCHGNMQQVGNDFSANFSSATPFPAGADLSLRIPWADEPHCQSCHSGDALSNLNGDPNVIPAADGIRLLRAYRSNDTNAKPIVATNRRFAENEANGKQVLYRLSKDNHAGVFCEACHGSTHAEWPVQPEQGSYVANDNMTALQLQGHTGVIIECTVCHTAGSLPVSLDGPHGMHAVADQKWVNGHEDYLESRSLDSCRTCHGANGEGTVLAKVRADRTLNAEESTVNLNQGSLVSCGICHGNPMTGGGDGGDD